MGCGVLKSVTGLRSAILEAREESDEQRHLPEQIVQALNKRQLFRMLLPAEMDAPEVSPLLALRVYEELARADASVAWVVWNSSLPCLFSRYLDETVRRAVFGNPEWKYGSSTRPTGKARAENGNYRLSGRWSLVSGCLHADWLALMFLVEKDGEIEMLQPGVPHMRLAFIPTESCEIIDTWHVGGLRGTGSHDVVVEDQAVPAERSFNPMDPVHLDHPIGRLPISCSMAAGNAAICLGIAQSALETVIELGKSKVSTDPATRLPDRATNQTVIATAATQLPMLRKHLHDTLHVLWASAESKQPSSMEAIADMWSASVLTGQICRSLVCQLYEVAGTPALYDNCLLERGHRDIHAAMQHIVMQQLWLEEAGRVKFGMEPTHPLFGL